VYFAVLAALAPAADSQHTAAVSFSFDIYTDADVDTGAS